eukprot:GFKZ01002432.1.p1 GENE.GFKZ01002432.1~~GFKZ01002432.1.p1  ORF type:complete len:561 (-),score=92.19 GFKZ01002432.1:283-1965(-)
MPSKRVYLAIDVGTGSARAAIFTGTGHKLGHAAHPIKTRNAKENYYEQSSSDIWQAIVRSVNEARLLAEQTEAEIEIVSVGVDATCSLVVCEDDEELSGISVVPGKEGEVDGEVWNVILWLDRRGIGEADWINGLEGEGVKGVKGVFGGKLSPENEPPKMAWLKKNKRELFESGLFFDLADWVTCKCCGDRGVRACCTVSCKWGWGSGEGGWNAKFWREIGLEEVCEQDFRRIGGRVVRPGEVVGVVTEEVQRELGVAKGCVVAGGMIDAHCGALWSIGGEDVGVSIERRLSVIGGTSTCFIRIGKERVFVPGVWGPFRDAVLPGFFVTEGGQSVTGKLLEYVVEGHEAWDGILEEVAGDKGQGLEKLAKITEEAMEMDKRDPAEDVHVLDYHAGNRSPLADPSLKGVMVGLGLRTDEWDLAVKFRAVIQSLCYGARHVIEEMRKAGVNVGAVMACGGLCKSRLFLKELADSLGIAVVLSEEEDTVLLGGGILGRCAERMDKGDGQVLLECLVDSAREMTRVGEVIQPNEIRKKYHDRKFKVYREMHADFVKYRGIMAGD